MVVLGGGGVLMGEVQLYQMHVLDSAQERERERKRGSEGECVSVCEREREKERKRGSERESVSE